MFIVAVLVLPAAADETITVRTGDTLFSIARRFGTSVAAIMQANGLSNPNLIYAGQRLVIPIGSGEQPPSTVSPSSTYVVASGDTLFSISRRFGVSVTIIAQVNGIVNPARIYIGQQLIIPGVTEVPTAPPEPGGGFAYMVQAGDTLIRIAARFNTTISLIISANNIANPNWITVGQQLWIPGPAEPAAPPVPGTPTGLGYGIQVHLPGQDMERVLQNVNELGFSWVKQQIEWKVYEPVPGQIQWSGLDAMINAADAHDLYLLLSVVKAPHWARSTTEEDGPPADFNHYWHFVGELANRYAGRVDAYEIWNEQNLRREWHGDVLQAPRYVEMLAGAYNRIKSADPAAIVVSGAPAPTGWNDGLTAVDDRLYLEAMYAAGLKSYSDAIGAHPNGWANHPTIYCCRQEPDVPSHNDHPSFFFRNTLEDYRAIMERWGDGGTPIWATEFGWGTMDGLGGSPQTGYEFVAYNTEAEQSEYLTQAFTHARAYGYVGVMFVWNLNFCPVAGANAEQCYWGILRPDGSPRPAYYLLCDMLKP